MTLKIAPEGYPFILVFFALSVAAFFLPWRIAIAPPLILTLFMVYFFRDPDRYPLSEEGFVSPADGRIISVKTVEEDNYIKGEALLVSIFMSPFDVHVNRSPCDGSVKAVKHTPGSFKKAYLEEAYLKNENTAMLLECGGKPVLVRQVAGLLARRTVCRAKPGDTLKRGERFGMIKFSSRVDVYLPDGASPLIKPGDKVRAGETIIATMVSK